MKIVRSLDELKPLTSPVILTVGNFDGVHLGHQYILKHVQELACIENIPSVVFTFSNHPSKILRPNHPSTQLTSFNQKADLIAQLGIDILIAVEFTEDFSKQSAEHFIKTVFQAIPFRRLILGYDAKMGHDRQGNGSLLHQVAYELHFSLDFLPLVAIQDDPISSSRIRKTIQAGDLVNTQKYLGRTYSIRAPIKKHEEYHVVLSIIDLCIPPEGVYVATILQDSCKIPAIAYIKAMVTELSLTLICLRSCDKLKDQNDLEIIFDDVLRPDIEFTDESLREHQMDVDRKRAKKFFDL